MALKFPADFEKCVREGGRVRTIAVKGHPNKYMHVCYDKAGKSHAGEVKTKKASELFLKSLVPQIDLKGQTFKQKTSEIEVLRAGEWEHPQYGLIKIGEDDIDKFVQSFDNKIRKVDLAVDQEHMPEKGAAGWYRELKKVVEDGKAKLKATVEWTKLGQQLIKDGIFKYFSPEFDFDYEDQETHDHFENVLIGGALTNRPYFKSLAPVALSENLYAGFTSEFDEKGGEIGMTKEELKAKLAEDTEFELPEDASDEDKKAFEEVKAELAKEAEDKEEKEKEAEIEAAEKEKDGAACTMPDGKKGIMKNGKCVAAVKASERFISKAEHTKELNELKSKMGIVEAKLRFKEVTEKVQGYMFSESNPKGVLLPKNKKAAVGLLMAATPKVAKLFSEFLGQLAPISSKLFEEQGGAEGEADKKSIIEAEANKMVDDKKAKTYGEAIKTLQREKPDLFKE